MLDDLIGFREPSVSALVTRTGIAMDEVVRALDRLVALQYAVRIGEGEGEAMYRAGSRGEWIE